MRVIFWEVEKICIVFFCLANCKFALFFGVAEKRKETTELLPRDRFPLTLLLIFEN